MKLAIFLRAPEVWGAERSLLTILSSEAARAHSLDLFISPGSPLTHELDLRGIPWKEFEFVNHASLVSGGLSSASPITLLKDAFRTLRHGIRARKVVRDYDAALTFGLWETA